MITSQFLIEKGIRELNEDAVIFDELHHMYGVFDGASSLVKYVSADQKTGGYIASHTAADTFQSSKGSLADTATAANNAIKRILIESNIDISTNINRFGCTAAVVRIDHEAVEMLQCGDSVIIVRYIDGGVEAPLGYNDQDITAMRLWRQYTDEGRLNIRELLQDEILENRNKANIQYGSLNGDERAADFFLTTKIPTNKIKDILVISDGMFIPKSDPSLDEDWAAYFTKYDELGLMGLYNYVRTLEKSDAGLVQYPRFKIHDDASAIAINFA